MNSATCLSHHSTQDRNESRCRIGLLDSIRNDERDHVDSMGKPKIWIVDLKPTSTLQEVLASYIRDAEIADYVFLLKPVRLQKLGNALSSSPKITQNNIDIDTLDPTLGLPPYSNPAIFNALPYSPLEDLHVTDLDDDLLWDLQQFPGPPEEDQFMDINETEENSTPADEYGLPMFSTTNNVASHGDTMIITTGVPSPMREGPMLTDHSTNLTEFSWLETSAASRIDATVQNQQHRSSAEEEQWQAMMPLIRGLYRDMPLSKVIEIMAEVYHFTATRSQYKKRFKKFKVRKNKRMKVKIE